jgi:branched-subunit amino acid aminotransferase/4-amino-4-deoxychorismate lyase
MALAGTGIVYLNGAFLPAAEAKVPLLSRAFLFGEGLFETIPVRHGTPFRLAAHLERMRLGAALVDLPLEVPAAEVAIAIAGVIERSGLEHGLVKAVVAAGVDDAAPPIVAALVVERRPVPVEWRERGAPVVTTRIRANPTSPVARAKTLSYLENILLRREAAERRAVEVLRLGFDGAIAEGAGSNIFFAIGGRLVTPAALGGILAGITRAAVIECARAAHVPFAEERVDLALAEAATEAFLTNVRFGVLPVASIDGRPIAPIVPGPITMRLAVAYDVLVERETAPGGGPRPA